ncbi:MAG: ATP-binding protein, partial [Actinomycetota bacterium]
SELARRAASAGLVGAWAAPVVGQRGTMAAIVGFTDTVGQLQPDQVQLLELFSTMAGAAIDRGRLVETLRVQNRSLEGLHGVLETLAGPELVSGSMSLALDAVCRGLNAQVAHLFVDVGEGWAVRERSSGADDRAHAAVDTAVLEGVESDAVRVDRFDWSRGTAALACWWGEATPPPEAGQLLAGAANSFRLAMERELTAEAEREAAALQRSREFERELARRLGHELRTPLTAIRGFASTMLQPDVQWPESEKARFLGVIENEADRMGRLVAQLFDDSAIESGTLRLDVNYCDLVAAVERAASIAAPPGVITSDLPERLPVWADSDRLEQVFVNLFANAVRHNAEGTKVRVTLADESPADGTVAVAVRDDGVGIPDHELSYLNGDHDDRHEMGGLGLRLVRGFVRAHGGTVRARVGGGTTVIVTLPLDEATT